MAKYIAPLPVSNDRGTIKSETNIEILYGSTNAAQERLQVLRRRVFCAAALTTSKWNGWSGRGIPLYPHGQAVSNISRWGGGDNLSNRDLIGGFVRLHVLHHANCGPIFGIGIIDRLAFLGYVLSPGTLYPILHGLEKDGFLRSRTEVVGKKRRRVYEITTEGQRTLVLSKVRLWELFKEVFEHELSPDTAGHIEKALRIAVLKASQHSGSASVKKNISRGRSDLRSVS